MENWWQSKCGSFWQQPPPPSSPVASSLLDSHTQISNAEWHLNWQLLQESMLLTGGMIQESMFPNMHDLDNFGHADIGASFLSLVSGPSMHVPCDEQHLLDPKSVPVSNLVSPNRRTANGFSGGSRVSVLPGALWPHNMDCPNMTSGEVFPPLTSSNANMNRIKRSALLQDANLNIQKSQAVACLSNHERDGVKSFSCPIGNHNASPVSADSWKLQKYAHITSLHKTPVESNVSAYHHVYNPSSSCPRVTCSGISGNLLLSDTGLLGVVCACHGLYMSISKFSEHSGSSNVNPENTVRMDNGETVAHWLTTFISKTGIRLLEGQRGWDWPEGISAASGLTSHPISSTSNNPDVLNQAGPCRASVSYEQQKFSLINSKENHNCGNVVDKYLYHERDTTSKEYSNSIFRDIINGSRGNLQHAAGQHTCGLPNSSGARTEKASKHTTVKLDSICESANSLPALPSIQDLKTPCHVFSVGRKTRKTSFAFERQGVSSNVELRLGQLPGKSHASETKFQPASGSHLKIMHAEPSKVFSSDKHLQKSNKLQGSGRALQYADIASNPSERSGSTQLEHLHNVGGGHGAITDYQKDSSNVSLAMTNVNSLLLSCFRNPQTKCQFRNIYDNSRDSHISGKLRYESHASRTEKICLPWSSIAGNIQEIGTNVSNAQINVNKGKEAKSALNGLLGAAKSNIEFSKAFKEDQSSFNLVLGESSSNCGPAFYEKSLNSHPMVADESYSRDILNDCWKISSLSDIMHFNHDHDKPIQSSIVPKEIKPTGFSSKSSVSVQSASPTLSKGKPNGTKNDLQDVNLEMLPVWNMLELSNRDNSPASVRSVQECEIMKNRVQPRLTIAPSIPKDQTDLLDSLNMPRIPQTGENSRFPGTICWMGHNTESFGIMTAGRSLYTEDPKLPPVEHLFSRLMETECSYTHKKKEHCSQGLPYAYAPEKCSSAAQENCLVGKYDLNGHNCFNLVKGDISGTVTNILHPKLNENCIFQKETAKSFEKTGSSVAPKIMNPESHSFQWRDVPKRIMESCSSTRKEQHAGSYNPSFGSPAADFAKCFVEFAQNFVPLKEQETSNISSGCSAPDVAQSSIEDNKKDSSTVEGGNIRGANNLALDEGSGNDRSWSSDDTLNNDFSAEFFGSASGINLIKREPFKAVPTKRSLSLIEEIRLQNSLRSKISPYKIKRSSAIREETDHFQKLELGPKKRRKTVKWMKLDTPVPVSGQSSLNNGSPKCTKEVRQNAHSFWEMQMQVGCHQGCPSNCADSVERSARHRKSAFSATKGFSQRKDSRKVYHQGEQQTTEAHKSSVVDDTLKGSEIFRKKRLIIDDASATHKEIQEICCGSAELTAEVTSLGGHSNCQGKTNFCKWMARPTVFGKYGIISNGNPSKPTKIIPLSKILKTQSPFADKSNRNAGENKKLSVKVKKKSIRHVKETALSKKGLKSQVKEGGTHNSQPIEPASYDQNGEIETASCSATNGNDDLSCTFQKCNNHCIVESKPGAHLKSLFKESRKRSLHELLAKGNCSKVVNSSVMKNSLCQTNSRCCGELMAKAVDGRAQTTKVNTVTRCSEKHHPENSNMFYCVCGGSDKDECNQLLRCNRFLIKGLRDEAEAVDNENVSFYGRLMPHAASHMIGPDSDRGSLQPGEKFLTCARTEGYKGRKREGFLHNHPEDADGNGGCLVPQEQLNAWLHIHRQKPQRRGHPKLLIPSVESDCRKAYARYKQSKSWEHLVVYKSGIHALGLYTSQFISRGAMVVEYVGEIVGLRVADRRESEYHSGKKLQHKSACYFFRIDKEHIIDATRKGGIARFVNHSCQPNCVAKIISVRTEKKVVFFAERDIYPGEEITYDYHFNHEDEGEKIPCYCNSKNCRRYLN